MRYAEIKRQAIQNGLLSCSQQGFITAQGQLCSLISRQSKLLQAVLAEEQVWDTPPLIRRDWIEREAWENWLGHGLAAMVPGGHLLTPKPLAHLLNRLRHHSQDQSSWLLSGQAFREVEGTLPLHKQIAFSIVESVYAGGREAVWKHASDAFGKVAELAGELGLPVVLEERPDMFESRLMLRFDELQPVPVCTVQILDNALGAAYGLQLQHFGICSASLERWCLAVMAGHGADPAGWPDMD